MNILPISSSTNLNFGVTSKVRIPMTDGTTTLLQVTGTVRKNGSIKITQILGDIMSKGKSVGKVQEHSNKNGLDIETLAVISEDLGKNAKGPDSVIDKIFEAINCPNVSHNG